MTFEKLAKSYLEKCIIRLEMINFLFEKKAYSDVIREAQEIVELATKGILRKKGIEPPKYHDVSNLILEYKDKFPELTIQEIEEIIRISKKLRKEQELAFYGDIDFIPTLEYTYNDAKIAMEETKFIVEITKKIII